MDFNLKLQKLKNESFSKIFFLFIYIDMSVFITQENLSGGENSVLV